VGSRGLTGRAWLLCAVARVSRNNILDGGTFRVYPPYSLSMLPKTLTEAVRYFASKDNCREYLVSRRWPNGVACPVCGSKTVYFDKSRDGWECKTRHPKRKFTLKTGTIFEDSPLGFDKWLPAVWLIANCKNGVSSWELHRAIGVTQKTAWFMLQRIRLAMQDEDGGGKLGGEVEVDETYIGGKARNMHNNKRQRITKTARDPKAGKIAVDGAAGAPLVREGCGEGSHRHGFAQENCEEREARGY
jgi:transposase-like protein